MISFFTIQNGNCKQAEAFKDCAVKNLSTYKKRKGIDTFVQTLKQNGIWNKVYIAYLFSSDGISATREFQHSINTKSPGNSDAAFRIGWTGGTRTHTDSGAGSTGYADTKFNPNVNVPNASSVAVAISTASGSDGGERLSWGAKQFSLGLFGYTVFNSTAGSGNFYYGMSSDIDGTTFQTPTANQNGFIATRINGSSYDATLYPSQSAKSISKAVAGLPAVNMYLFGMNNNGTLQGSGGAVLNTFMVTSGLTGSEVSSLNAAITSYNNNGR